MKIEWKLLMIFVITLTAGALLSAWIQRDMIIKQGIEMESSKIHNLAADGNVILNTMGEISQKHASVNVQEFQEELKQKGSFRETNLYKSVPVIMWLNSMKNLAKNEKLDFHVYRKNARNPDNEASQEDLAFNQRFQSGEKEILDIDYDKKIVTAARPITLNESCMACHGNPKLSPTGDGKDIFGFPMENWSSGSITGGFALKGDISHIYAKANTACMQFLGYMGTAIICMVFVVYWILQKQLISPLKHAIAIVEDNAAQTSNLSGVISSTSVSLKDGAKDQDKAIKHAQSSIQRIYEISKVNYENTNSVNKLANRAQEHAREGNNRMKQMVNAMNDINNSSTEITSVISTIEEIASETQMLALNASIEASRAGKAGAGFAVVANEVRELAERASKAARDTTSMIEASNQKSIYGVKLCDTVGQDFNNIQKTIEELNKLVSQVEESSKAQSTRMDQISVSMSDIQNVSTQSNTNTQMTAEAAVKMKERSKSLKLAVEKLQDMIREDSLRN